MRILRYMLQMQHTQHIIDLPWFLVSFYRERLLGYWSNKTFHSGHRNKWRVIRKFLVWVLLVLREAKVVLGAPVSFQQLSKEGIPPWPWRQAAAWHKEPQRHQQRSGEHQKRAHIEKHVGLGALELQHDKYICQTELFNTAYLSQLCQNVDLCHEIWHAYYIWADSDAQSHTWVTWSWLLVMAWQPAWW